MITATHSLERIRELAVHWVDRQLSGRLSKEELAEFDTWQKTDERHEECVRMSTASRWTERMRDGNVCPSEREAFRRWLLADPRNIEEFRLAARLFMMGGGPRYSGNQEHERDRSSSIDADYLSN